MSRVCRESGIWRDVDFSGCTLTPPTDPTFQCPEPFLESPLLVWMLFDTSDRQRVVDSTPQLLSEVCVLVECCIQMLSIIIAVGIDQVLLAGLVAKLHTYAWL